MITKSLNRRYKSLNDNIFETNKTMSRLKRLALKETPCTNHNENYCKKQIPHSTKKFIEVRDKIVPKDNMLTENEPLALSRLNSKIHPKALITTCRHATKVSFKFISEFMDVLNNSTFFKRQDHDIYDVIEYAKNKNFSDILVFHEKASEINGLLLVHLPNGPAAFFRVSSVILRKKILSRGRMTKSYPELIFENFNTKLGKTLEFMFASLFHREPHHRARKIVTFCNQQDFIFVRHHRYQIYQKIDHFRENEGNSSKGFDTQLNEIGPRFTLKLEELHNTILTHDEENLRYKRDLAKEADRRRILI